MSPNTTPRAATINPAPAAWGAGEADEGEVRPVSEAGIVAVMSKCGSRRVLSIGLTRPFRRQSPSA